MPDAPNRESEAFSVNARPDAQSMSVYRQMALAAHLAVAEFVDNSITSALNAPAGLGDNDSLDWRLTVDVKIDAASRSLSVSDNAAGIARGDIERALIAGRRPPKTDRGLGVYGFGMKVAAFKLGDVLQIETHPLGGSTGWRMELDLRDVEETNDALVQVTPISHRGTPGTVVTVKNLAPAYTTGGLTKELMAYLPSIYRSFIRYRPATEGDRDPLLVPIELRVEGQELSFEAPELLVARTWSTDKIADAKGSEILWKTDVEVTLSSGKTVRGWVGLLKTLSAERSGFFLHYRGRGVLGIAPEENVSGTDLVGARNSFKPSLIFGAQGTHRNKSIIGEFDVSEFPKGATTNSIEWTQVEESDFIQGVLAVIRDGEPPIWQQAANYRRNAVKTDEKKKAIAESPETKERVLTGEAGIIEGGSIKRPFGSVSVSSGDDRDESVPIEGEFEHRFMLQDSEGSFHQFAVAFISDPSEKLLRVDSKTQEQVHRVFINDAHPAIADLQPLEENTRLMITRFGLAVAASDVFEAGDSRSGLFESINNTFIIISEGIPEAAIDGA